MAKTCLENTKACSLKTKSSLILNGLVIQNKPKIKVFTKDKPNLGIFNFGVKI